MKATASIFAALLLTAASTHAQSVQSGVQTQANTTGLNGVHFFPGTYQYEIYAPGKTITGKLHQSINYQITLFPGIDYTSNAEFEIKAGNPNETVSVWFNIDENPLRLEIWDATGHLLSHTPGPQGVEAKLTGFQVIGTFSALNMVKGKTYYGVWYSTIFPLISPTPTPSPTPCP
jgi:hypothetical protein